MTGNPARAAEMAARDSYGRLLAYLSARTHDIALAEDALSEAFLAAIRHWPERGVPANPDAWLLTAARNRLTDRQRHQTRFPTVSEIPDMPDDQPAPAILPDERLSLLMVCAHPAIAADLHIPLMLQTVLGLDAATIARLFMTSPTALSKRLVRAKAKIRDAAIPFRIPDNDTLPARSAAIFEAVYALHAHDWLDPGDRLGDEALYLADLLCRLLPDSAEAPGLAALIALGHARAAARVQDGMLIATEAQDPALWDDRLIAYGNRQLARAFRLGEVGRYQIEAAIEAAHVARKDTGATDWQALEKLYFALNRTDPTAGSLVAQAMVTARLHGPEAGLVALERAAQEISPGFQPLWAARASLYAETGQTGPAATCYAKAISLATDTPTIAMLKASLSALPAQPGPARHTIG